MNVSRHRWCLIVAALSVVTACERPTSEVAPSVTATSGDADTSTTSVETSVASTTAAPSSVPTTSAPPSTPPPDTTAPPTTSPTTTPVSAPPTTSPPSSEPPTPTSPDDLVLAFDGVQPFTFGAADVDVVPAMVAVLGEPATDAATEYPIPDEGQFVNDNEIGFVAPFGRTVCFENGLCVEFGAGSSSALQFVGWQFSGEQAAGLATVDGITVGSLWADHTEAIVADRGACFSVGYGSAEGIDVTLESSGEPFVVAVDGEFETRDPDPADVRVTGLSAGDLPIELFADC